MTVGEALQQGTEYLSPLRPDTPFLDATLLLSFALGCSREQLFARYPDFLSAADDARYRDLLARRAQGIPVSYIRNRKEFYGLEFFVDERVLVPRPDTETLVEAALDLCAAMPGPARVLDLCTGSGCIAISLKYSRPALDVTGADISPQALEVFRINADTILGLPLPFILSNLFEKIDGSYDLIVSNPPYVEDEQVAAIKAAGSPEPALALAGGHDGTDLLVAIIHGACAHLSPGGWLLLEAAPHQMKKLADEMAACGYINTGTRRDLAGRERVLEGRRAPGAGEDRRT